MPNRTEQFIIDMAEDFFPPLSLRSDFTSSRLALLKNNTTCPVLTILAERKFGEWRRADAFPFWIDGDSTNETLSNVALARRNRRFGMRRPNKPEHLRKVILRGKAG